MYVVTSASGLLRIFRISIAGGCQCLHVLRGVGGERERERGGWLAGWLALSRTKVPIYKRYMYARLTRSEVCLFWRREKKRKKERKNHPPPQAAGTDTPPMSFPFLRSPCPHPARLVPSWWRPPISNSNHPPPRWNQAFSPQASAAISLPRSVPRSTVSPFFESVRQVGEWGVGDGGGSGGGSGGRTPQLSALADDPFLRPPSQPTSVPRETR